MGNHYVVAAIPSYIGHGDAIEASALAPSAAANDLSIALGAGSG